jgi:phosphohistidine phosphatase
MRRAARGLAVLLPDVRTIASSPLSRAVETAEILLDRYSKQGDEPQLQQLAALAPGRPANQLLSWLGDRPREGVCVIVGHEPYLSQFICWTLTGVRESFVELKKGAACLLQFDQEVRPGKGKMLWAMRPGQLRKMCGAE